VTPAMMLKGDSPKVVFDICHKAFRNGAKSVQQVLEYDLQPVFAPDVWKNGIEEACREIAEKAKNTKFSTRQGKRAAVKVKPLAISRVRFKNYPDYTIDEYGQVYDIDGKLVKPRWKNQRCWVRIYDHTGKRCERNVFWLMVDAGFVTLTRDTRGMSGGNTTSN
jgi:hypothetical protein